MLRVLVLWLLAAALAVAVPAAADTPEERAVTHFLKAKSLFEQARFADARVELETAASLDPNQPKIFIRLAETYDRLDELLLAIEALERALALPMKPHDEREARTRLAAFRTQATKPVAVTVVSPTDGAVVERDNTKYPLPKTLQLPRGATTLRVSAVGHRTRELTYRVRGIKAATVSVPLEPVRGSLVVSSNRPSLRDIQIRVDGTLQPETPEPETQPITLLVGQHEVVCRYDDKTWAGTVIIAEGRATNTTCEFQLETSSNVAFWSTLAGGIVLTATGIALVAVHAQAEQTVEDNPNLTVDNVPHPAIGWSLLGAGVITGGLVAPFLWESP